MTITLSPEALDLVQRGRQSLIEAGPEGHMYEEYWNTAGTRRCGWGHIINAARPGHALDQENGCSIPVVAQVRFDSPIGREIDHAYESLHGHTVDYSSSLGWAEAVAGFDALLIAALPDWEPSRVQGAQHAIL